MKFFYRISAVVLMLAAPIAHSAGLLKPVNSQYQDLQIKQHHVDVTVYGAYVTTSVEQVFHNPNEAQLEAIYSFPVPEHAAVGEFIYWIDGQPVVGEVVEKQRAREIYQQEQQAGRDAAIVEQDEYKTFDISVTPVLPRDDVKIRLVYVQAAMIDSNVGRYVYPLEEGGVDEEKAAFWTRNDVVSESFNFDFHLRSAYPIDAVRLPQHAGAVLSKINSSEWNATLANSSGAQQFDEETGAGSNTQPLEPQNIIRLDKDIVVYWRLADGLPGSADMIVYRDPQGTGGSRGTFMFTITPGDDLKPIQQGSDWTFVLDVSGSMQGKYASLAEGVRQGLKKLRLNDRFRIVLFNNSAKNLTGGFLPADAANVESAIKRLENWKPEGGTNLYAGLDQALSRADADRPSAIVLVTDGVANVGVTEKKQFLKLLEKRDVRMFTFIMGNSANRPLLEEMTAISNGYSASVSNSDDVIGQLMQATSKMTHHAFRDFDVDISGGRAKNIIHSKVGSLYRGEQLTVMGHYYQAGEMQVEFKARVGAESKVYRATFILPESDTSHPELERLWGYNQIRKLNARSDYLGADADVKQAIVDTAVEYGLVTDYTSMIVVRDEVFDQLGIDRNNKARVENEQKARADRKQPSTQSVPQSQPISSSSRPSLGSGGGSVGAIVLMVLLVLTVMRRKWSIAS
ncbi:MAG: VIT and VWA domain-containing protein [Pseudomonadota bacterium]